jgi:hypothetical protein
MKIKKFKEYNIFENFYIPNVTIEEFLTNVEYATDIHKTAIEKKFNTYKQYIDILDEKKHLMKVNDITGDILNNNRVILNVYCFHSDEIDKIKENMTNYCINTFYSEMPTNITIFNINVSPLTFINKEALTNLFTEKISKDDVLNIMSVLLKADLDGAQNDFVIWRKKDI